MQTTDENIFAKCKESLEDVAGWKIFLFLPHSFVWRLFIVSTSIFTYIMRTFEFFYGLSFTQYYLIEVVCNVFYFGDTLCATLHAIMVNTRKLRHGKKRHVFMLFIDYLSLIPFEMFYRFFIYTESQNIIGTIIQTLRINVCLRMYQIILIFDETRYWIYRMSIYMLITLIGIVLGTFLITHLLSCIYFYRLNAEDQRTCLKEPLNCVIETELVVFSLLSQSYMVPSYTDPLKSSLYITIVLLMVGYFLTYGIILPITYFAVYYFLLGYNEHTNRSIQLDVLLNNLTNNKMIRDKIWTYFQTIWTYGKGSKKPDIVEIFPPSMQKSIFCDVHWDAFKHSEFLGDLSLGCKRSLSMRMKKDFVLPNTVLLEYKKKKGSFIYLESGVIQIMAEENDTSPVITFFGGTVFCETSLFYEIESKAILKTAKLCVIHYLSQEDFVKTMLHYPKDMKKIFKKIRYRMMMARAAHERKTKIYPYFVQDLDSFYQEKGNIKWIKQQYRSVLRVQKTMDKEQKSFDRYSLSQKPDSRLYTQLDHTSFFLSLIVVNDEVINKYETVCLRIQPLWFMDPDCSFLKVWKKIIIFFSFVTTVLYPIFIGWYPQLPLPFFNFTVITSFIYLIDVFIFLFTAIKDKNVVISHVGAVFIKKLGTLSFYFDVLAALPFQLFMYISYTNIKPYILGLCLVNNFFKSFKLVMFLGEWNYEKTNEPLARAVLKNVFWLSFSVYWLAMFYKLTGVECIFYDCGKNDWFSNFKWEISEGNPRQMASFYLSLFLGLDLPHTTFKTSLFISFLLYFISYFLLRMLVFLWTAEIITASILQRLPTLTYRKLIEVVNYFLHSRRISGRILDRVNDTLRFQWYYDRGNYITQENRLVDDIPLHLRDLLDKHSIHQTIHRCPLFKMEEDDFLTDICRKSHRIALPANSVLITFGVQTMYIYVVHKGYTQINSFLPRDIISNVGTPFLLANGDVFPIIIAFNQIPAVVTARTLTDCELIVIKVEDILTITISHQVLKDIVMALKSVDLKPLSKARPGLSKVDDLYAVRRINLAETGKWNAIRHFLGFIFYRQAINSHTKRYMRWEVFRLSCIYFNLLAWPFVYGCLAKSPATKWYVTLFLLAVDSTTWIDFYVRMRIAYYNRRGIYISHPVSTMIHYLTSAFIIDVVSFTPYFHVIYLFRNRLDDYGVKTILSHMILRHFNLYRIMGFLNYISVNMGFSYQIQFSRYLVCGVTVLNTYVNLIVRQKIVGGAIIGPNIEKTGSTIGYYFIVLVATLRFIAKINFYPKKITWRDVLFIAVAYFAGKFIDIVNYAYLMINFLGAGKRLSDYQYYLKSFIKFLNGEKIEEKYVTEAIDYYEHVWSEMEGINFRSIFSRFPNILHEDIVITVYKSTLRAVACLSQANEAFYRIVARNVNEIYMEKGSIIIFKNQVNSNIFFIHKGQCEINDIVLCKGSMIGDIRSKGLMKHTIVAKTHVVLLKIPSTTFFSEMENFWRTKKAFEEEVAKFDDYVQSAVVEKIEEDAEKIMPHRKPSEVPEAEFEILVSRRFAAAMEESQITEEKRKFETPDDVKMKAKKLLHPASKKSKVLSVIFLVNAFLTVIAIPIFMGIHSVDPITLVITYILDAVWFCKIGVTLRTAILNPKTGILSYTKKAIFRKYLYKKNGLVLDILSVFPCELFPILKNKIAGEKRCFSYFFLLRVLRFFYIIEFVNKNRQRLSINSYFRWCVIVIIKWGVINFFVSIVLLVSSRKEFSSDKCYSKVTTAQWEALGYGYLCVLTFYCGTGTRICIAENDAQIVIEALVALWGCVTKAVLFAQVVIVLFRLKGSKFQIIRQIDELEKYLVVRNISPALLGRVKRYVINLIDYCHEEGMPIFLKKAPDFIKFHVMGNLYVHHLSNCHLFRGVDETFIIQLATRLERFVFFPGNYITMQGDIDHSMYFVHKGEIYCLEKDKEYASLEKPVDLYVKNECFGMLQGLFVRYPHSHSYRAKTLAEVLVLNYRDWADMRTVHPDITRAIYEKALKGEKAAEAHHVKSPLLKSHG